MSSRKNICSGSSFSYISWLLLKKFRPDLLHSSLQHISWPLSLDTGLWLLLLTAGLIINLPIIKFLLQVRVHRRQEVKVNWALAGPSHRAWARYFRPTGHWSMIHLMMEVGTDIFYCEDWTRGTQWPPCSSFIYSWIEKRRKNRLYIRAE